jgi:predicted amidohydrolase
MEAIDLIREQVARCETEGIEILCCPEAILGGLADYSAGPVDFAISVDDGQLARVLSPLASDTVTTILGFTELAENDRLYNSAAVFHRGDVTGVYRKLFPAIRKSVYTAGNQTPVFTVGALTFGIVICNDSNFEEPTQKMAEQGATVLFVPANNGLPLGRADVVAASRKADAARATRNNMTVVRADVAGRTTELMSVGSSAITAPDGTSVQETRPLTTGLLIADLACPAVRNHRA